MFKKGQKSWVQGLPREMQPRYGAKLTEAHKAALLNSRKGISASSETRKKQSEARKKFFADGKHSWNWKGGISKIDKLCRTMPEYKQWRSNVFQRDNWTCKTCGFGGGKYVTVHHKKSFALIIKQNNIKTILDARICEELWDTDNGVTLCEECHSLTDNYKGRGRLSVKSLTKA